MESSSQGFIPLDNIILELIAQLRKNSLHSYVYILNYALIAYRRLLYNTIPISKTICVPVNKNKTITLPNDFHGLITVGLQNGDRVVPLHEDTTINRVDANDKPYYPAKDIQDRRYSYTYFSRNGDSNQGKFEGAGIDGLGTYKLDLTKRCIVLSVNSRINTGDSIVLDYISDGFNPDTATMIYAPAAEMLKANVMYQWNLFNLGGQAGKTEAWRLVFLREQAEFRSNISNLSKDGILAAMARVASTAPKY